MRWYWVRIALGALIIFLAGYAAVTLVRTQVGKARDVFASSRPITIPLAFLPFTLDGQRAGTFSRVTIRRESPQVVAGVDLRVSLSDSAVSIPEDCRLTTLVPGQFSPESGFRCAGAGDSAVAEFGTVRLRGGQRPDRTVPLVLDHALIAELRREGSGVGVATGAFAGQEAAEGVAKAEQIRVRIQAKVDSARSRATFEVKAAPPAPPEPPK